MELGRDAEARKHIETARQLGWELVLTERLWRRCVPNSRAWAELTVASSGLNSMPGTGRWLISGEVADASATASSNPMRMCVSNCDIHLL
jgi:hypothetical protein